MLFNSVQYLLFLPAVVLLYWLVPSRVRPLLLLVASYAFYMSWKASYGLLLAGLTLWNFAFGILLARSTPAKKRLVFIAAVTGNLGCLALFKYTNFLIDSFWSARFGLASAWTNVASIFHQSATVPTATPSPVLDIILPLGISFFVFEFIHYLVDIHKGDKPITNPVRFGLFAAFFPSQIAGPIKRFQDFDEQVVTHRPFDSALFRAGLILIIEGMFKKVVLGDNLAQLVQPGFEAALNMGTLDAWICVAAFTLQIYYDFSGYTDIGRGSAMLLGYRLPENFNIPYIASNLSEFWTRWHISLSTWLRDYLYIPMGGSKTGRLQQARNLCLTMLLGGLWHGASWHYVVWGAFHGVGLVISHTWRNMAAAVPALKRLQSSKLWSIQAKLITLFVVMMGWVVFRADNMHQAMDVYQALFRFKGSAEVQSVTQLLVESAIPQALLLYCVYQAIKRLPSFGPYVALKNKVTQFNPQLRFWLEPPVAAKAILALACCLVIVGFAPHKAIPFIYFQF